MQLHYWLMVTGGSVVQAAYCLTSHLKKYALSTQTNPLQQIGWTGYSTNGMEDRFTRPGENEKERHTIHTDDDLQMSISACVL